MRILPNHTVLFPVHTDPEVGANEEESVTCHYDGEEEKTASGMRWVSVKLLERALNVATHERSNGDTLTGRETEVAQSVARGLQNKEIADNLGIANGTVRTHVHSIFRKFGVQNRVELSNRLRAGKRDSSS